MAKNPLTVLQVDPSPSQARHLSYFAPDPNRPSQPSGTQIPSTQISLEVASHFVPSVTVSLNRYQNCNWLDSGMQFKSHLLMSEEIFQMFETKFFKFGAKAKKKNCFYLLACMESICNIFLRTVYHSFRRIVHGENRLILQGISTFKKINKSKAKETLNVNEFSFLFIRKLLNLWSTKRNFGGRANEVTFVHAHWLINYGSQSTSDTWRHMLRHQLQVQ